jgi:hypothetical protein
MRDPEEVGSFVFVGALCGDVVGASGMLVGASGAGGRIGLKTPVCALTGYLGAISIQVRLCNEFQDPYLLVT